MKKRSPSFSIEIDQQTTMYADIEPEGSMVICENIMMVTYLENTMEVDIWCAMPEKYRLHYIEKITEAYKKQNEAERDFGKAI